MRTSILLALGIALLLASNSLWADFRRGDANMDGWINLSDAGYLLDSLFFQGAAPTCDDAADVNDDGKLSLKTSLLDVSYLLDWLYPAEDSAPPEPRPPFKTAGPDPTPDTLGCADPKVRPPSPPEASIRISFQMPPGMSQGQKGVEVFLQVSTEAVIEGFSLACRVNSEVVEVAAVDFEGTLFPEAMRAAFESSPYFRTSAAEEPNTQFDSLHVGALFFDGRGRISLPGTRQAVFSGPLLRILLNVKDGAPLGEATILENLPLPGAQAGAITELVLAGKTGLPEVPPPGARSIISAPKIFLRGDVNNDRSVDIADPVGTLLFLFGGLATLECLGAADANADDAVNLTDPILVLDYLFRGGPALPAPFPGCMPYIPGEEWVCERACGQG